MSRKKAILRLVIFIFIFSVCWQLFLTSGFKFFWEDLELFHFLPVKDSFEHDSYYKDRYSLDMGRPSRPSLAVLILKGYTQEFFKIRRLFQIGFANRSPMDRPYALLTWDLLKVIFGDKAILYRALKAIIFAINTCLIFFIINRASRLLALLGVLLYMSSSEVWLAVLYLNDLGLFAQCGTILSVMLFIKLTEKHPLHYKDILFYYFLIMLASNFAILVKGDGRYLAIIFFLTILFFRRKELKFHLPMLVILLMMEFPVLGFIKKVFYPDFSPINFASHIQSGPSTFGILKAAVSNYTIPLNAIGKLTVIALCASIAIHLLRFIFHKNSAVSKRLEALNPILKERLFLFILWFFSALVMIARIRGFPPSPFHFFLCRLAHFIAPFIIFLCYYISLISGGIKKPYRNVFVGICIFFLVLQILSNGPRLNRFRGAWGNYFCGWQNVEGYIDKNSNNALVLAFTGAPYKPFLFRDSNNKVLNNLVIKKEGLSEIVNDFEGLFSDLVRKGYIDERGVVQDRLRWLKDESKIVLADAYITKRAEIYKVLKPAYGLPVEESPFCDLGYIESKFKEGGFSDILVAAVHGLKFRGESKKLVLKQTEVIDGDSGDLYDRLKRFIGHPSRPLIYLYHFNFDEK